MTVRDGTARRPTASRSPCRCRSLRRRPNPAPRLLSETDWEASMLDPSAHRDSFARDHLPPVELWPVMDVSGLAYPKRLNAAVELLDRMIERGCSEHPCIRWP